VHTFDIAGALKYIKVSAGLVVVFLAERFHTKYEPKWQVLDNKVRPAFVTVAIQDKEEFEYTNIICVKLFA